MSVRDDLRRAVHARDRAGIDRLGWTGFFETLDRAWPKRLDDDDRLMYASILGHHDPKVALETLQELARSGKAEWRPKAAQLAAAMPRSLDESRPPIVVVRPDQHPITLGRVRDLLEDGAAECACTTSRTYRQVAGGVLRCIACDGIEQGQVDAALDAVVDEEAA